MDIRLTEAKDWMFLKQVRLAALLDTPTAFGVSYQTAAQYSDEQWKERASSAAGPEFWLAIKDSKPVGMIGAGVSQANRYNLIGMWVEPAARGSGVADLSARPRLPERLQTGLLQILWAHHNTELAGGVEVEKKGLRQCGDVGGVLYVDHKNPTTLAILLGKVRRLRFDAGQDAFNNLAHLPGFDKGIEGFIRALDHQ
jgi:hypothetical protein